jgi:hypothetical protein
MRSAVAAFFCLSLLGLLNACGQSQGPASTPVVPPLPDAPTPDQPGPDAPSPRVDTGPELSGFLVEPYLQSPGSDRMTVMFEPDHAGAATVEYRKLGEQDFASQAATVMAVQANAAASIETEAAPYTARLTGLASNTSYEYRIVSAAGTTPLLRFKTWPAAGDGVDTGRFMVISDTQSNNPDWITRVMEQGLIAKDCAGVAEQCAENIHGIIIPGDIVNDGDSLQEWRETFFGPGKSVFRYVPIIPAIGNHDYDLKHYLIYFDLPDNGSPDHREEWYRLDFLNLRLLTLQTNLNGLGIPTNLAEQNVWAAREIQQAAQDDGVDYLFAQLHHPCKSELWIPGENEQTCVFVSQLEQVSADTGKITGHLFGHTHAYSRGQSRDVPHLWMNAASASGNIDDWGDYEQADYDEFETSWDEYGYSIVEFATSGTPRVSSVRRSGGDDSIDYQDAFSDAKVRDVFVIGGDNQAPAKPVPITPDATVNTADVMLHAAYVDADGDPLHEAHWQLRQMVGSFNAPLMEAWGNETRAQNVWFRRDLNAGLDVDYWRVPYLAVGSYCWRVRYRDSKLAWSPWADEACFAVSGTSEGPDLVVNGGAESGVSGWTVVEGTLEAIPSLGCPFVQENLSLGTHVQPATLLAAQGAFLFAVGGCTDVSERARAVQMVDVTASAAGIDAGQMLGVLQASLRTFSKWDVPTVRFRALAADGTLLGEAKPLINQTGVWQRKNSSLVLPAGTRQIEVELGGVQQDGVVNDSFVDDVQFRLITQTGARQLLSKLPVLSPGNGMALIAKKPDIVMFEASLAGAQVRAHSATPADGP